MATTSGERPHDRRRWGWIETATAVLVALGFLVSLYLTWIKLTNNTAACAGIGDCDAVNRSRYAEVAGIPIALVGMLGYLAIGCALVAELRWPQANWSLRLGIFGMALAGTLYSAYLTYVEVAILHAVCPYCVISAICMVGILILSVLRLRAADVES
jgi:uncharacterized membrane protein